ncbi:MAG: pyridoxamine 5'-phosphate oxidase family protein [Treponema sp.]|nr:pyridoxamine 5'-phosphate oxidase family protein [Treponema sp.]
MRRTDREKPREFALDVVDRCAYSVLATVNPDGAPYCVPLSLAREGEWLYFHSAHEGHKIDNLRGNNRVCVCCVGDINEAPGEFSIRYESAIVKGVALEITDSKEKIHALKCISVRYTPKIMADFDKEIEKNLHRTGVWKIRIDEITGKGK